MLIKLTLISSSASIVFNEMIESDQCPRIGEVLWEPTMKLGESPIEYAVTDVRWTLEQRTLWASVRAEAIPFKPDDRRAMLKDAGWI